MLIYRASGSARHRNGASALARAPNDACERTLCCTDDGKAAVNARSKGSRKGGKNGRGEERVHFQLRDKRLDAASEHRLAAAQNGEAHARLAAMFSPAVSAEVIAAVVTQHGGDVGACADAILSMSATEQPTGCHVASTSAAATDRERCALSLWDTLPEDCKYLITCKLSSRDVASMACANSDMQHYARVRRALFTALHVKAPLKHIGSFVMCHPNAVKVRDVRYVVAGHLRLAITVLSACSRRLMVFVVSRSNCSKSKVAWSCS